MEIEIKSGAVFLKGDLIVPEKARALVIFVHGSGSSRNSPRNKMVANKLHQLGMATLLFDLLTIDEEESRNNVFDIDLLTHRLMDVTSFMNKDLSVSQLPIGYFGASTGAAAALVAATRLEKKIFAVVSRGGRVDLAADHLSKVKAPTLMIVGGEDREVLDLNNEAQKQLSCENEILIIPGATHLFDESGALEQVADAAGEWFLRYLNM